MTCIVGIEHEGHVFIGGDLQGTDVNIKVTHTQPKVFRVNGVLFGFTTSYRFGQILEHKVVPLDVPTEASEVYSWLVQSLVPQIQAALEKHDWGNGKCGKALIGVHDQLWNLQDDFSVFRTTPGYDAIGAGAEYALGSIYTSLLNGGPKSEDGARAILATALGCAATFGPTVGPTFEIISTCD